MTLHDDDRGSGRVLARRQALTLLGTTAGIAVLGAYAPKALFGWGRRLGPRAAGAAEPCVVRPEQTEGPYFVDERLNRTDIRSDPATGAVSDGTRLSLAFVLQRLDGSSCVPLEGALVDLWHCDALGVYSDVQDAGFDTRGQQFLRGYQLTDANGAASFVTIYPGWYQGRTVHMHFKIRTDPDSMTGFEFTSQLFFDDALTDVVHAQQPYAAKGQRTLRNDGDGIYANGGSELLLAPTDDGAGGYTATFNIAVALDGTTTTTVSTGGTTTTVAGSCDSVDGCLANLQGALPDPARTTSRRATKTARALRQRVRRLAATLDRASTGSAAKQQRLYGRARSRLASLLARSQAASGNGTLEASLAGIEGAVNALLAQLPA